MPCLCPLPLHPHPPPRINDCLSSFAPNHDQDAEAIENVYSDCKNPPCSTKWPVFTLMGLLITATLFMCVLNWRWASARILEGDQPCLGAAKPHGEFIHRIPFLSVQQIGSRITLLWGRSMLPFWLPKIIVSRRWNKIDIKTLDIAFASSSAALSTHAEELQHTWCQYTFTHFSSPHEDYFDLMPMIIPLYLFRVFFLHVASNFSFLNSFTNSVFYDQIWGHAATWPWGNDKIWEK